MAYVIEWVGTGSGLNPALGNTSFIVRAEGNRALLVDCGATVPLALMKEKRLAEITDVLITHAHADHIGGLEGFGFMHYFALKRRGETRPNLHVANDGFARDLWEGSLKGGMTKALNDDNEPFDATLDTYFNVHTSEKITIPGLPTIEFFPTLHVMGLENYGVQFADGVFYSGDTVQPPKHDAKVIFQDCQFYKTKSDVHIPYEDLKALPTSVKAKTHLVHLGGGYDKIDCKADGFAGFVMPGDIFTFE